MKVRAIKAAPYHVTLGALMHPLAQRLLKYATENIPECDAQELTKGYMARAWAEDPSLLLLGLVDERGEVVGHLLATLQQDGKQAWANVAQYRADGNVGDAGLQALDVAINWAQGHGVRTVTMSATNLDKRWEKRGFKPIRHQLIREWTGTAQAPAEVE